MKVNRMGITRVVFEFTRFVVKIPNPTYSWKHFLQGLIANIKENGCWKNSRDYYERRELLCPIIWTSWGGWILIMAKADMNRWNDEIRALPREVKDRVKINIKDTDELYHKWIDVGLGGDDKADNYGYYQDRLVKVDYAD